MQITEIVDTESADKGTHLYSNMSLSPDSKHTQYIVNGSSRRFRYGFHIQQTKPVKRSASYINRQWKV
jgi:hypothetical protein